jgi:uncharacterized protein (DUF58 family)
VTEGLAGGRFLDPRVLARVKDLGLVARAVVEGFTSGLHRSPYLGVSVDFAEHRAYMPGDDIRRIDWRVFARTDRFYVKEFEADSNANFLLLLDVSRSMHYGSDGPTKLDYGRLLAASLAFLAAGQRDRVGLLTFDEEVVDFVPPGARRLDAILHALDRVGEGRRGELRRPLLKAVEVSRRRGILVVISDLYEEPEAVRRAVSALGHRGSDVIVFHLLDPSEVRFDFEEATAFEDMESGERLPVVPARMRERYRALVQEHVSALARLLGQGHIDYTLIETSQPLDLALHRYLTRREHVVRSR